MRGIADPFINHIASDCLTALAFDTPTQPRKAQFSFIASNMGGIPPGGEKRTITQEEEDQIWS